MMRWPLDPTGRNSVAPWRIARTRMSIFGTRLNPRIGRKCWTELIARWIRWKNATYSRKLELIEISRTCFQRSRPDFDALPIIICQYSCPNRQIPLNWSWLLTYSAARSETFAINLGLGRARDDRTSAEIRQSAQGHAGQARGRAAA